MMPNMNRNEFESTETVGFILENADIAIAVEARGNSQAE